MYLRIVRPACVALLAVVLVAPGAALAESLAGKVGDQRHPTQFANATGPCEDAYKDYVKAAGH
jgi:hypothetical protein